MKLNKMQKLKRLMLNHKLKKNQKKQLDYQEYESYLRNLNSSLKTKRDNEIVVATPKTSLKSNHEKDEMTYKKTLLGD